MPTIDIPDKICPCCGGTKWRVEHCSGIYKDRLRYRCSNNAAKRTKKYYYSNIERSRESSRIRNHTRERTPELKEYENSKRREYAINLTDTYVKRVIFNSLSRCVDGITFDDISKELIDMKRNEMILYKILKTNDHDNKNMR